MNLASPHDSDNQSVGNHFKPHFGGKNTTMVAEGNWLNQQDLRTRNGRHVAGGQVQMTKVFILSFSASVLYAWGCRSWDSSLGQPSNGPGPAGSDFSVSFTQLGRSSANHLSMAFRNTWVRGQGSTNVEPHIGCSLPLCPEYGPIALFFAF